jgi:predicted ester cyclase
VTSDGFEHNTALFYLSRFLLAEGLLESLERAERPIIMSVAGPGQEGVQVHWDDLGLTRGYDGRTALGQSGRLEDLHAVSFADRHPDTRTRYVLFHPGLVSTTFSGTYDEPMTRQIEEMRQLGKPVAEAIKPILAVLDEPPAKRLTAFVEGRPFPVAGPAFDPDDARRLDELTQRMLNRAVLRRFIEDFLDKGDGDALDECVHADIVLPPDMPGGAQGYQALVVHMAEMPTIFDSEIAIEDMIAEGDKVAARITIRGRQTGEFMGRTPTGREFSIEEQLIVRFRDGKISRLWRVVDIFSLLQQLDGTAPGAGLGTA